MIARESRGGVERPAQRRHGLLELRVARRVRAPLEVAGQSRQLGETKRRSRTLDRMSLALGPGTIPVSRGQGSDLVGAVGHEDLQQLGHVIGAKLGDKDPKDGFVEQRICGHAAILSLSALDGARSRDELNRSRVTGLVTKSFMPASRQASWSWLVAFAVRAMM